MFTSGDYVVCGNNGICQIQAITTLNISGVDKTRQYYILKPVFSSGSTVYTPVDTAENTLRKAMNKEQATTFISSIPNTSLIPLADEKTLERTYKEYIRQNSSEGWLKLIKTIYLRKEKRLSDGHKVTAVDSRYFKLAEDFLYGELSIALNMSKDEVREHIIQTMNAASQ